MASVSKYGQYEWFPQMRETENNKLTGKFGMWKWLGGTGNKQPPSPRRRPEGENAEWYSADVDPNSCRKHGKNCKYTGYYDFGMPEGTINIFTSEMKNWGTRHASEYICRNCKISPEARKELKNYGVGNTYGLGWNELRRLRIINDNAEYVPFDANWIDQFPEVKRLNPLAKNYYVDLPIYSEKDLQTQVEQVREEIKNEPLVTLNEPQKINEMTKEIIKEESFIDKNKNYLIIGGVAITALILILAVRKK